MITLPQYGVPSGDLDAVLLALNVPSVDELCEICRCERRDIDQTVETDHYRVSRAGDIDGFSVLVLHHMTGMGMDEISIYPGDADPHKILADAVRAHAEACRSAGDAPNTLEAWGVASS